MKSPRPPAFGSAVIIGAGAVGTLLAECLADEVESTLIFDCREIAGVLKGDATEPTGSLLEALLHADLVILSLPEDVLLKSLKRILSHVQATTLVVETGSVKSRTAEALGPVTKAGNVVGINPMFAPSLGFAGQTVVTVRYGDGVDSALFRQCLLRWGARIVDITPRQHDELVATVQAATHAALLGFCAMIRKNGIPVADLLSVATPPFRVLLMLVGRILSHNPAVYWQIQTGNPCAATARAGLLEGLATCDRLTADADNFKLFDDWLATLRSTLGDDLTRLDQASERLLSSVRSLSI